MELSLLCGINILLTIVDKNNKIMIFSSDKDIKSFVDQNLKRPEKAKELFSNADVFIPYNFLT
jgi:hypothetical protein